MHFYPGSSAMTWLAETPIAVIVACQKMLPRLEAQDTLRAFNREIVSSGQLKRDDARKAIRKWEQAAAPAPSSSSSSSRTPAGPPSRPRALPGMRVGVRHVPLAAGARLATVGKGTPRPDLE
jgi:hypothetical protein